MTPEQERRQYLALKAARDRTVMALDTIDQILSCHPGRDIERMDSDEEEKCLEAADIIHPEHSLEASTRASRLVT